MPHQPGYELTLLGPPGLWAGGRLIRLTERRAMCLLAYLGEAGRAVSREEAATLLWPEADPETGRTRLRRLIYKINTLADGGLIEADRLALRFASEADIQIDSREFAARIARRDLAGAIALWRGPFLEGLEVPDSEVFSDWLFYRRESLKSRYVNALEREADRARHRHEPEAVITLARRLIDLDPLDEGAHRSVIAASLDLGDRRGAQAQYDFLARALDAGLGAAPSGETRALLERPAPEEGKTPRTRYTQADGVHIAWQTYGAGAVDIIVVPGFVSHLDRMWEDRYARAWLDRMSGLGRLILFDRRGVGLSDRVEAAPDIDATARDIGAVMEAAGSPGAILFGASEGGPGCVRFAVDHPDKVKALVLWGTLPKGCSAPDFPHALSSQQYDLWLARLISQWGGPAELETFAPGLAGDPAVARWWARLLRAGSSPGAIRQVLHALREVDVRPLLGQVRSPAIVLHRRGDRAVRPEAGRALAAAIPGADFRLLEGDDHWYWAGEQETLPAVFRQIISALL